MDVISGDPLTLHGAIPLAPAASEQFDMSPLGLLRQQLLATATLPSLLPLLLAAAFAFIFGWLLPSPLSLLHSGPESARTKPQGYRKAASTKHLSAAAEAAQDDSGWYVTEADLREFQYRVEEEGEVPGAGKWQPLLDKDQPGVIHYTAHRRALPGNMTEYKSVTITPGATAEEIFDFSLDDACRCRWENFLQLAQLLEQGQPPAGVAEREQVVRYVRHFPMGFITDREYVIARRAFKRGDALYAITKGLDHPGAGAAAIASGTAGVIRIEAYSSCWRCRTIPDPWGAAEPACEMVLLHCEGMRIPESLAKMAIKMGMLNFVKEMAGAVPDFLRDRRSRVGPTEDDPKSYSYRAPPTDAQLAESAALRRIADGTVNSGSDGAEKSLWQSLFGGVSSQGLVATRSDALRLSASMSSDDSWLLGENNVPLHRERLQTVQGGATPTSMSSIQELDVLAGQTPRQSAGQVLDTEALKVEDVPKAVEEAVSAVVKGMGMAAPVEPDVEASVLVQPVGDVKGSPVPSPFQLQSVRGRLAASDTGDVGRSPMEQLGRGAAVLLVSAVAMFAGDSLRSSRRRRQRSVQTD